MMHGQKNIKLEYSCRLFGRKSELPSYSVSTM